MKEFVPLRQKENQLQTVAHNKENQDTNKGLSVTPPPLQLKKGDIEEEEEIQMKAVSREGREPFQFKSSSSNAMPDDVQSEMENVFGQDFSNVNIHANSQNAEKLDAHAYTQGDDIHFASGQYNPKSPKGQELLVHELTHVVQQREGRVKPTVEGKGMSINDNPSLEKEADEMEQKWHKEK